MSLLAVDMGTSSCKAVAFSEHGRVIAQKSCFYSPAQSPQPSWAEMPADSLWQGLTTVCRAVSAQTRKDPVEALSISSHGETFVPVDSRCRPVAPAIFNFDNRAVAEAKWLAETLGPRKLFDITGLAVHPMYPAAKILWIRKHLPKVFASAIRFLAVPDYLLCRLGLPAFIDYSLASRFFFFDIRQRAWSTEILSACHLSLDQLPLPAPTGSIAGELSVSAAKNLGLKQGTVVVVGGHDQPCASLGSGALHSGRISASLGTYECLAAASDAPALNDRAFAASLNSYCHVIPDQYVTLAYFPSGIMLDWFLRLVGSKNDLANQTSINKLCATLEADTSPAPSGLCITPHLPGTCNPDFNPEATGVIAGVRPATSRADLYKGILEGIACEFALMTELLQQATGAFPDVYVSGGGLRSPLGLKLRAALAGCELHLLQCREAVCLGTAILAGVAVGKYQSFESAVEQVVRVAETIHPEPSMRHLYAAQMSQYILLYSSLAPLRQAQAACH